MRKSGEEKMMEEDNAIRRIGGKKTGLWEVVAQ